MVTLAGMVCLQTLLLVAGVRMTAENYQTNNALKRAENLKIENVEDNYIQKNEIKTHYDSEPDTIDHSRNLQIWIPSRVSTPVIPLPSCYAGM